ncbi:chaperonin GroEL, partial [Candidatus Poribacteria bacterium]|nr:chaperonin GroEL [Candidatus Poribacteria bacterium]
GDARTTEAADELIGLSLVRRALEAPVRQLASNAGAEGSLIVEQVRTADTDSQGYNAATLVFEDLVAAGIIDPTKVVRSALQNAASVAGIVLTTEAAITEVQAEDDDDDGHGHHHH